MNPRPYDLGQRQPQIDETRRRIVEAARALLADAPNYVAFTVDAVAKRADVARATVYYQFGSKAGLLEALCDALAESGNMAETAKALAESDPVEALRSYIAGFGRFWAADRLVMRRLRALAALDPDVEAVIAARNHQREIGLGVLVDRVAERVDRDPVVDREVALRLLYSLTSFETFDAVAGPNGDPTDVVPIIVELAEAILRRTPSASPTKGLRHQRR
jgi:AcrR family transcriptional regulator